MNFRERDTWAAKKEWLKSAIIYKELLVSMIGYYSHLNIYFSDIDIEWLKGYEASLRIKGLSENSMGVRFRT